MRSWKSNLRHGMYRTSEYRCWQAMKARCYDANNRRFTQYGGRGIRVCDRWRENFAAFFADVGPQPSPAHKTLERENNDGHYEPDNVRWATRAEQNSNQQKSLRVNYRGRDMTVGQAAQLAGKGVSVRNARDRIFKHGWPVDLAVETPALIPGQHRQAAMRCVNGAAA